MPVILECRGIEKEYINEGFMGTGITRVKALKGINFKIEKGKVLGIVGESGSGKSTLAKIICGLESSTLGELSWGTSGVMESISPAQMVFQNPYNSLNPKLTVGYMLKEAISYGNRIKFSKIVDSEIKDLLNKVGMGSINTTNYPHQFSGGQRQRLGIARALALKPDILVCDEAVSALDISIQAQIINLLIDINRETSLTIIFIAHDIEVVGMISDDIMVMKDGMIMEYGSAEKIVKFPENEYTRLLLDAVPKNPWI